MPVGCGIRRVGGLTAERRAFRERIRLQAGERFAAGEKTAVIAKDLRVSVRSVERWRRAWREGGMEALPSGATSNRPVSREPYRKHTPPHPKTIRPPVGADIPSQSEAPRQDRVTNSWRTFRLKTG
uniref:helix-turn-helix domain-containing protein n=1 Tax=Streptomyces achromogenes TaxID=67255 RepID=UPI0027D8AFFA|nr:helix-turn-helix domain-containing protein [Streptomyces achromogenes]